MKYEIGKSYSLPCIKLKVGKRYFWFVILHAHLGEISGEWHRHIDVRFTSNYVLGQMDVERTDVVACGMNGKTVQRRMVCKHEYAPIKHRDPVTSRFKKLQGLCKNMKLDTDTMKCPHQGCDLSKLQGQTSVVCPCHGVEWSLKDGSMIV